MAIASVAIGSSNTTVFTASGDKMIATMIFCNTGTPDPLNDSTNLTYLTLHLVKSGDSISTTNTIVSALAIPAGETVFFDTERIVLATGDTVVASTSGATVLVCTISTVDI
jgi:hypothetical protein